MEKHFCQAGNSTIFYRQCGSGPLLFMLHPSPRNSRMLEPLMKILSSQLTCIAPDMPGYGFSLPLPQRATAMSDYVPFLHELIQNFPSAKVMLYGTATGAQLAIAYALQHPQQVKHVFLDNCAHFEDDECEAILKNYFPDFSPATDGSHLTRLWQYICDSYLFFPWYDKREENRIATELPPATYIQKIVDDFILAGPNYADAYKAAFLHERADRLAQLSVPSTLFRWAASPLQKQMDRLLSHPLPKNIKVVDTPLPMAERFEVMRQTIVTFI